MKICFVDPKGLAYGLNTGIAYLVSYLNKYIDEQQIRVFDFNNNDRKIDERIKELSACDLICFSIKSFTIESALKIASAAKRRGNLLVCGGPHITLDGINFLKENIYFDYAIFGEGEMALKKLVEAINNNETIENIKGVAYRKNGKIIFTGNNDRLADIDLLPFPDYSSFDSVKDGIYDYPLVTSRGCPYLCTYCCVRKVVGQAWYARSVNNIIAELKIATSKYYSRQFHIQDDNFTFDISRAKVFCDELKKNAINLKWACPNGLRADRIDAELMQKMKQSGCSMIFLGIESGNEEEFKSIKKGESLGEIAETIKLAHKNKISVSGNFIIGLPHSNYKSIKRSVKYAKKLHLESCVFNLLVPYQGTEIWNWVKNHGRFLIDWKKGFSVGRNIPIVFETKDFTKDEKLRAYCMANIKCKYYFAFIDENEKPIDNIINILKVIIRYDLLSIHEHLFYWLKHIKRILARIAYIKDKHA